MVVILVLLMLISFLTIDYFIQRAAVQKRSVVLQSAFAPKGVPIRASVSSIPAGILFDRSHQWMEIERNGKLKVGIDHFPGAVLGSALAVELPTPGTRVRKGDVIFKVKKGDRFLAMKALADGVIEEVNSNLSENADTLKQDPYDSGWVYRMKPAAAGEVGISARMGESAVEWMKGQYGLLRDFVGSIPQSPALASATLQDGGEPVEGFADQLNDEQWTELQNVLFA